MAVTNQELFNIFLTNPNMSDSQIVTLMETRGISPEQVSSTFGIPVGQVAARVADVIPPNQAVLLGDTYVQAVNQVIGSGEDQQIGGLENVITYKTGENQVGGGYQQYTPTGELERTGVQQEVNANKDFLKFAALTAGGLYGLGNFNGLLGGAGTVGTTGLTTAELAQLDLALGGAGGTAGAMNIAGLAGGTGAGSLFESLNAGAGAGGDYVGSSLANVGTAATIGNTGMTLSELTQLDMALGGAGGTLGALTLAEQLGGLAAGTLTGGLLTSGGAPITPTTPVTPTTPPTVPPTTVPPVVPPTTVPPVIPPVIPDVTPPVVPPSVILPAVTSLLPAAVSGLLSPTNIGNLLTTGATTAAGLLQQQTSAAAAKKAQEMIDRETILAKQAAQFKPIGMTTRFGTSQFKVDPITGQLISAGYTLSPEAKAQQDRLMALSQQGLTQAEGAQAQFAPLQTGAQSLFGLGNQYLAQSPQDVAQNYLNQQMALLQPGRETELANLQNKLQQQGRGGLSVAQGGTMGATTPELQALYNARAQQEAQLAANAQQYGQQNVLFGAGLLGQGTTAMGNYYAGQQAAYAPYTTALGQVQNLETLAQQPLTMGAQLGQTAAQAGFNVGQLGLKGAGQSVALATSPAATNNPYASALSGLGASNAFGQALGGLLGGGLQSAFGQTGLGASGFGTGLAYGNQDLGLYL
jgi:hypothetical protein